MKSRGASWLILAGCALLLIGTLVPVTMELLRLERAEHELLHVGAHQERMRLALWRMDAWCAARLAREAARPASEYEPYRALPVAYDRMLRQIVPYEVRVPSPLLTFDSDMILLHFEVRASGEVRSPQVPISNERDLAEASLISNERVVAKEQLLDRLRGFVTQTPAHTLDEVIAQAEARTATIEAMARLDEVPAQDAGAGSPPAGPVMQRQQQIEWSKVEQSKRAGTNYAAQLDQQTAVIPQTVQTFEGNQPIADASNEKQIDIFDPFPADETAAAPPTVGPLVPIWLDAQGETCTFATGDDETPALMLLVRRLHGDTQILYQGMMLDWPALREELLGQIRDLFPDAVLEVLAASHEADQFAGRSLATIPVALVVTPPPVAAVSDFSPTRRLLLLVWLAMAAAIIAVAITLRAITIISEKRSRFASAVTHELRTPLTTFRMYSEMLAEGMVRDDAQRKSYLHTLKDESSRLATLVENVLAYSRLERGRSRHHPRTLSFDELLAQITPPLERRAAQAGLTLDVDAIGDREMSVTVDPDVVGQILFNLVDNACKYAADGEQKLLHLAATIDDRAVTFAVRDHGPGVPAEFMRTIFAPFDRGSRQEGDPTPGVGLGLALSRGLARSIGGDLRLRRTDHGACFTLTVPRRCD